MNELIPIESVNAIDLFHDEKTIEALIEKIRVSATDFDPDVSTPDGRKIIAAQAYKVAQSKGVIDKAGKALTDGWFKKKKVVDAGRRTARDALDALRDEIRKPLDDWKAEEQAKIDAAALVAEIAADEIEAHEWNGFLDREARVLALEAKLEAERLERERIARQAREETERKETEKRLRLEAEEKARQDAADELQAATDRANRLERERIASKERAEQEKKDAAEFVLRVKHGAAVEKQEAIEREQQRAKDELDRLERERLRIAEDNEREAQQRAANKEIRRKVNNAIVEALVAGGVSQKAAKQVVILVASGKIPSMSIRY